MKETLSTVMGFVKMNFFKIMGVFLIIGLLQYVFKACGEEAPVEATATEVVELSRM
tara:strand:- start:26 stop:193 length:168 start_codon:yes stop_codon:yes gene_type:complete